MAEEMPDSPHLGTRYDSVVQNDDKITIDHNKVLLGVTGSVASIKLLALVEALQQCKYNLDIQVVTTEHAKHFFEPNQVGVKVWEDSDEWKWSSIKDPVLHIELRKWADIMLIAPLDANSLAKISNGLCDNLLTCIVRAWDMSKPLLFAPAMNTHMWSHPYTARQIGQLTELGYQEIPCIVKTLACGDFGYGAMAEVPTLVQAIITSLETVNNIQKPD